MTNTNPAIVTHVRVINPSQCAIHLWTLGAQLEIRIDEINIPDKNGLEPWVRSNRDGRWVWLAETDYELIDYKPESELPIPEYRPLQRYAILYKKVGEKKPSKAFWMNTHQEQAISQFQHFNPGIRVIGITIDNSNAATHGNEGK